MRDLNIEAHLLGVSPRHRQQQLYPHLAVSGSCTTYLAVPGNAGLPTAGTFLHSQLKRDFERMHRDTPFDLIHAHGALPCGHAALSLGQTFGVPFVVSAHGLDVFSDRQAGPILGSWCRRVSETVYKQAQAVICVSQKVEEAIDDGCGACTRVIYNGVDTSLFSPGAESGPPRIVLCVGNLIPSKGHVVLLRAFARVGESCELHIIGDGPERRNLGRLAGDLGIASRVRFLGKQSRTQVSQAMKGCTVFALPSSYEGLGCVYLEAMACGKPAIGCTGQGISEVIEDSENGLLVPPEDESALSDALWELLHDRPLRERLGSAARETIERGFTLQHQAQLLAAAYRECAL